MDCQQNYDDFYAAVLKRYSTMSDQTKNNFLNALLQRSSSVQWNSVEATLTDLRHRDFIALLPQEISETILSFCDTATLLVGCQVSKRWNEMINSDRAWRSRFKVLGLTTTKKDELELKKLNETCKMTFRRMLHTMKALRNNSSFDTRTLGYSLNIDDPEARELWGLNLIVAKNETLVVWDYVNRVCVSKQSIPEGRVVRMKCDKDILVISLWYGTLLSFRLPSLQQWQTYQTTNHTGPTFAFDVVDSLDLLATGSTYGTVRLWSLSRGHVLATLVGHRECVLRLTLRPALNIKSTDSSDSRTDAILMTVDKGRILVWSVPQTLVKNSKENENHGVVCTADIPNNTGRSNIVTELLVGQNCYYIEQVTNESVTTSILHQYDVLLGKNVYQQTLAENFRTFNILAVGKKFMCTWRHVGQTLLILDVTSGQRVSMVHLYDVDYKEVQRVFRFGNTDWLDGFNGRNNKGPIFTAASDLKVVALEWKSEYACPEK